MCAVLNKYLESTLYKGYDELSGLLHDSRNLKE